MARLAAIPFEIAIGLRMIPQQKRPKMAYFKASPASSHSVCPSSAGGPSMAIVLHDAQYFWPRISTRQFWQKGSAQPVHRSCAATAGCVLQFIGVAREDADASVRASRNLCVCWIAAVVANPAAARLNRKAAADVTHTTAILM